MNLVRRWSVTMNLSLKISKPPDELVIKVQQAIEFAIPTPASVHEKSKEPEISIGDSERAGSVEHGNLPSDEPYWVADIESSVVPAPDPPPPSLPAEESEDESSGRRTSIETRLLAASFPLACSTILLMIHSLYGSAGQGWLIFGGLAWSGIILSVGIILKSVYDFVRDA
jgi:hypothetical protein